MPDDFMPGLVEDMAPTRAALLTERGYPPAVVVGTRPELSDLPLRQQRARLRGELDVDGDQADADDGTTTNGAQKVSHFPVTNVTPPVTNVTPNRDSNVAPKPEQPPAELSAEIGNGLADLGLGRTGPAPAVKASPACSICGGPIGLERSRQKAKTCDRRECQLEQKRRRDVAGKERRAAASSNGSGEHALVAPQATKAAGAAPQTSAHNGASNGHTGTRGQVLASVAGQRPADIALGAVPAPPTDRLGPLYHALMLAGASVTRLEVVVAEETWRITRRPNERDRP